MDEIKYCVDLCQISERRRKHEEAKEQLFTMERQMALMTFDREVGLYANRLDRYIYLLEFLNTLPPERQGKVKKEISALERYMIESRQNYKIIRYRALRSDYEALKKTLGDYYQAINVDLRRELSNMSLSNIYIYQLNNQNPSLKHIIVPNRVLIDMPSDSTIIYPFYDIYSNRDFRHFYNKTSFKYLEGLSKDNDYNLGNKQLGMIKIKKM